MQLVASAIQSLLPALIAPPHVPDRSPLTVRMAIAIHQNTWAALHMSSAFLQATDQSERMQLMWPAEDAEDEAFDELLRLPCGSREGAASMLAHLEWYASVVSSHPKRRKLTGSDGALVRVRMADMRLVLGLEAPTSPAPVLAAIEAHRAAWQVYTAAPRRNVIGFDAWWAFSVAADAAADAVLEMPCGDRHGAKALDAHAQWYAEELAKADDDLTDGFDYALRRLQARQADLSLLLQD